MASSDETAAVGPLFIGGVPRSGTHALASLVGQHSRYTMVPRELGFHTGVGEVGLPNLLEGSITLSKFVDVMKGHWWKRTVPWDQTVTRGLYKTIPDARFQQSLERFVQTYPSDALSATRTLMHSLLDPIAVDAGTEAWIEMDPYNFFVAPVLYRLFPDMKIIHIMRDGRDVAMSLADLPWGDGGDVNSQIWEWQRILRKGNAKLRTLPSHRVLTVQLEDLVGNRRDETYTHILSFLALQDDDAMHSFFDQRISSQNAHVGRWRSLSSSRRLTATVAYACALAGLAMTGVSPRPTFRQRAPFARDFARRPQEEQIDPWADGTARDA